MNDKEPDIILNIYPVKALGVSRLVIKCVIQDKERIDKILRKVFSNQKLISEIAVNNRWKAIPKLLDNKLIDKDQAKEYTKKYLSKE